MNYDKQVMINATVDYCVPQPTIKQVYVSGLDQTVPMSLARQCEEAHIQKEIRNAQRAYAMCLGELDNVTDILFVAQHGNTVKCSPELHKRACHIAKRKGLRVPELRA